MGDLFDESTFVVLTRGRTKKQVFLESVPASLLPILTIVCHPGEREMHFKNWGGKVKDIVEYKGDFVGEARDWCIDYFNSKYIFFFEDNLKFHTRVPELKPDLGDVPLFGLSNMTKTKFSEPLLLDCYIYMLDSIYNKLKTNEFGMVGVSHRTGNNRQSEDFVENTRLYGFWAIHKDNYKKLGSRFSDVLYREDFFIELKFLLNAKKIGVFFNFAIDKAAVNTDGGCNSYRTPEGTNENAYYMQNEFPGLVKAVIKSKKSWKGYGKEVVDVVIYWKKAYQQGVENVKVSKFFNEKLA